jgi:hypothetical protein
MQVILSQDEILSALELFVRNQIAIKDTQKIIIDLKAGRGENGFSANLDIVSAHSTTETNHVEQTFASAGGAPTPGSLTINASSFIPRTTEAKADPVLEATPAGTTDEEAKPTGSIFTFAKSAGE